MSGLGGKTLFNSYRRLQWAWVLWGWLRCPGHLDEWWCQLNSSETPLVYSGKCLWWGVGGSRNDSKTWRRVWVPLTYTGKISEKEHVQKGRDLIPFCWVCGAGTSKLWSQKPKLRRKTWIWGLLAWKWFLWSLGKSESNDFNRTVKGSYRDGQQVFFTPSPHLSALLPLCSSLLVFLRQGLVMI